MKILTICHKTEDDLGTIKNWIDQNDFEYTSYLGYCDDIKGLNPEDHDVAIIMGGSMGVYQADLFPYLYDEIAYIQKRLELDLPTLGICLGAQMMAKACGKDVFPGKEGMEIGWHAVEVNEAGTASPVRHLSKAMTMIPQFHGDTFDLPEEATLLASSKLYQNQAFSVGKNATGLQFHPEVTQIVAEMWMVGGFASMDQHGLSVPEFRAQSQKNVPILEKQMLLFLDEWLASVTQ